MSPPAPTVAVRPSDDKATDEPKWLARSAFTEREGVSALGPFASIPGEHVSRSLVDVGANIVLRATDDDRQPIRRQGNGRAEVISGLAIARRDGAAALGPGVAVPGEYAGRTLVSMPSDIVAGTANDCRPPIRRQGNRPAKQVLRLTVTGREGGTALGPVATVLDEHPSGTLVGVRADVVTPTTDNCGRTIGRQGGYAIKAIV